MDSAKKKHAVDLALNASPSIFYDAVVVLAGKEGDTRMSESPTPFNSCETRSAI